MTAWDAVAVDGLVALLTEDALMTMPPERMRVAGAQAIGAFMPLAAGADVGALVATRSSVAVCASVSLPW
jgi:hypothetical protein